MSYKRTILGQLRLIKFLSSENSIWLTLKVALKDSFGIRQFVTIKIFGCDVTIRTSTPDIEVARSTLGGEFESASASYPKESKGLIIDAGGYIGTAAIAFARMYPAATIVTVEASSENFRVLQENVARYPNIKAFHAALLPVASEKTVQLFSRSTGEWGFTIISDTKDGAATFSQEVATLDVPGILSKFGYSSIMIMKMDIEGAELGFLTAPKNWLPITGVYLVELHERIVKGCEAAFSDSTRGRFIYKLSGEKFASVNPEHFLKS
jgi:FkbM family methyltransferase